MQESFCSFIRAISPGLQREYGKDRMGRLGTSGGLSGESRGAENAFLNRILPEFRLSF